MINGLLNVYKEKNFTSNDVVAKLRGILQQRKIGHAGTLDPEAEGVLPVLLGTATRLSDDLMEHTKTYRAVLRLGIETDTEDMTGQVTSVYEGPLPGEDAVREAIASFAGGYEQTPPMYSAKKVNGKKLYDLAREGKVVERKSVHVVIDALRVENMDGPLVTFSVDCSKGTYIRTLCRDIGERLGCGGCMDSLKRLRVGTFYLEDALTLGQLQTLADAGRIQEKVIPCEELYLDCFRARTKPGADKLLFNGNYLTANQLNLPEKGVGEIIRVCSSGGIFVALYKYRPKRRVYVVHRMLLEPDKKL